MSEEKLGSGNVENYEKQLKEKDGGSVNLGRHMAQCQVCKHPQCREIEEYFINWGSTQIIQERYGPSRDSMYRHAHAFDLFSKRRRNFLMILENFMERGDMTPVSGSVILGAFKLHAKMTNGEQGAKQAQAPNPHKLFERMSKDERESFARDGSLPEWFSRATGATPDYSQEGDKEGRVTETTRVQ